jgi:pimeloyl-ACP methyl ester carboxylesterase
MSTCFALMSLVSISADAQDESDQVALSPAPDYQDAANWACRPGAEEPCTAGQDTVLLTPDNELRAQPFKEAADPPIDCFYVYPTVSLERRDYADMARERVVMYVIHNQAGPLASRCRVFAPLYRQSTIYHLRRWMGRETGPPNDTPYNDVVAAWKEYLEHDNHGRGVVLVGHSQGSIHLLRLLAEHIDGTPAQRLLVAAFLAGEPSLGVTKGQAVGGDLAHIPVCTSDKEAGCVYAWGSYLEDDTSSPKVFGAPRADGLETACSNPTAPAGGAGTPKSYFPGYEAPAPSGQVVEEVIGGLSAECVSDASGANLRVKVLPGPHAEALMTTLKKSQHVAGWGLHNNDVALYLGNILDLIDLETQTWLETTRH